MSAALLEGCVAGEQHLSRLVVIVSVCLTLCLS